MTIIKTRPLLLRSALLGPLLVFVVLGACAKPDQFMERPDVGTPAAGGRGGAGGAGGASGSATGGSTGSPMPGAGGGAVVSPTGDDAAVSDLVVPVADAPAMDGPPAMDLGPVPVPCGNGPGQTCCENEAAPCSNNCGTMGTKVCKAGAYGACSVADTCCGDPSCTNNCGEKGNRTCSGTTWGACPVPMRGCCPGDTTGCNNNCGTPGTRSCTNGSYGACSVANTCCGERSCNNNCGENGTRPCNGTTLGNCSVPERACCPGQTRACSNSCGMSGTIPCRNGRYDNADCTAKDSSCQGAQGQACRTSGTRCNGGLFCCDIDGRCSAAELNRCQTKRGSGRDCNKDYADTSADWCNGDHYCNGDSETCEPKQGASESCGFIPGSPKCRDGLRCDPLTMVCTG